MTALVKLEMDSMSSDSPIRATMPMRAGLIDVAMAIYPAIKIADLYSIIEGRMGSSMAAVCRGAKGTTLTNHINNVELRYTHQGDGLVRIDALGVTWVCQDIFTPDRDHLNLENNCSQAFSRGLSCMWAERHGHQDIFQMMMELSEIKIDNYPGGDAGMCALYWTALATAARTCNGEEENIIYHHYHGVDLKITITHTDPGRKFIISCSNPVLAFRTEIDMSFLFPSVANVLDYIKQDESATFDL